MSTKYLTQSALTAAIYVVLTLISQSMGLASGLIQLRISEALCVLPVFMPAAIPGLAAGCALANLLCGAALPDIIFGSLATFIGAFGSRMLKNNKYLCTLPTIAANTIIVPLLLRFAYGIQPLWLSFLTVFAGEVVSAGVLGVLLFGLLSKHREQLFPHEA